VGLGFSVGERRQAGIGNFGDGGWVYGSVCCGSCY
jgi:hypothetical protein